MSRLQFFGAGKIHEVRSEGLRPGRDLWFIGDIHGDLLGLEAALAVIRDLSGQRADIVFLGDLIDDGFDCSEVIVRVLDLIHEDDGFSISMIAGNHDEALVYDSSEATFKSMVQPGDYATWLNLNLEWGEVGRAFIHFVSALPRAIFFEHGLFASHAGFPHSDTWEQIASSRSLACLEQPQMLKDFTWNRLAESRRKIPNRSTSGSTFGSEDFSGFCEVASQLLGYPIDLMVRGHDHISDRSDRYSRPLGRRRWSYEGKILTVNNMSFTLPRETGLDFGKAGFARRPTLARWRVELGPPTPVVVTIPDEVLAQYVVACENCGRARSVRAAVCAQPDCASSLAGSETVGGGV